MPKIRARGENIRKFILNHVEKHPTDISKVTATRFDITRQAVNKHLQKLTAERALAKSGNTRNKVYKLAPISTRKLSYKISPELEEDVVWRTDIKPTLGNIPENVLNIWDHGK